MIEGVLVVLESCLRFPVNFGGFASGHEFFSAELDNLSSDPELCVDISSEPEMNTRQIVPVLQTARVALGTRKGPRHCVTWT